MPVLTETEKLPMHSSLDRATGYSVRIPFLARVCRNVTTAKSPTSFNILSVFISFSNNRVNRSDNLVNGSTDEHLDQPSGLFDIFQQIEMYSNLVIIPVGVILNFLCLFFLVKSKISQSPTGLTLTCLAVADNIVVITLFIHGTTSLAKYLNIPNTGIASNLICKLDMYFLNVGFLLSGLLLAFSTIERYVSVRFPLQVKSWNLYFKTKILLILYFTLTFGLRFFAVL